MFDRILPHRRADDGPRRHEPRSEHRPRSNPNHNQHSSHSRHQSNNHNTSTYNGGSTAPKERATLRQHFTAMSAEFVGTVMFLFFAFGATQIANVIKADEGADVSKLLYISLAFGFSLATTAWVFYRVSGGLFNPAVSPRLPPFSSQRQNDLGLLGSGECDS